MTRIFRGPARSGRTAVVLALFGLVLAFGPTASHAQTYPTKPITLIVPWPAGGSTGIGTSPHLLMEEIAANAKATLNQVPFKGNADLQQALFGGHVMAQSDATGWDKFVDDGQMRLLVTFGDKRTKRWPNVPTAQELGYGYRNGDDYAKWARETFVKDKGLIERLGLAAK